MLGWGRGNNSLRVDRDSLVADISNISVVVVRGVLDSLGTAIGESNRVLTSDNTVSVSSLRNIESGVGVVVSNTVLVSVGLLNLGVGRGRVGNNWSTVGENRGSVGNNWGRVSDHWGSMSQNWSMMSNSSMRNNSSMSAANYM